MPPIDNYYCTDNACDYKTAATNAEEADQQLASDGGCDLNKETKCPTCGSNTLVFL